MSGDPQGAFRALADPTRRQILMSLRARDMTIGEVVEQFDITRSAVRKHLTILEEGALISVHVRGRERVNRLRSEGLDAVSDWFEQFDAFWDERLQRLKNAIEENATGN